MSHGSLHLYTTDFNSFNKCYFQKGELSIVGYEQQLIHFYKKYKQNNINYFEQFLKSVTYLPDSTIENIFALLPCLLDIEEYRDEIIFMLKKYRSVISFIFLKDISIKDEILQVADHLNCIEDNLGAKVLGYLNTITPQTPKWLKEYSDSVLKKVEDENL